MTFECDHCGGPAYDGDLSDAVEGATRPCLSCGFPGRLVWDAETPAEWSTNHDLHAVCFDGDCVQCRRDSEQEGPKMKTRIIDNLSPEDIAMAQALYSRSPESVDVHLEKVRQTGSGKFMQKYYVGYGHKSIADCGTTTLFIEGVSLLAAKAVQDWPLYCGQETSTRFIDMARQPIIDMINTLDTRTILFEWMRFYAGAQEPTRVEIRRRYPRRPDEDPDVYERAVKARTFDILRGFLPAGITTQLSWHTNLRQAGDHLALLRNHPSPEIASLGEGLLHAMRTQYPSSFSRPDKAWDRLVAQDYAYDYESGGRRTPFMESTIVHEDLDPMADLFAERGRGDELPHSFTRFGQMTWRFPLDFGSFRDLQRHRNGVCVMPLLTTDLGFEPWYLEQLDPTSRQRAALLVLEQTARIAEIRDPVMRQYYCALGFRVPCTVCYALPATVYLLELRSSKMVHPTLRRVVQRMADTFKKELPMVVLHDDQDEDDWSVRRGTQTIVEKVATEEE
jgi:thymidylate synthase ThyX